MAEQYGTELLKIQTFGSFSMEYKGDVLSNDKQRSKQLWLLLEYMIVNRFNEITLEKLDDVLWRDNDIDNLAGALKNLIYRLRNMLGAVGRTPEREYIVSRHGYYAWNNDIPCIVDSEEMLELYRRANLFETFNEEALDCYLRAIDYYKGDFLSNNAYEEWVVPMSAYYRNIYFDCVYKACNFLMELGRFDEVDRVCSQAIIIGPFEDRAHVMKMRALVQSGKHSAALSHYEYVTSLYYKELGIKPSDEIRAIYSDIAKQTKNVETDIAAVKDYMKDAEEKAGGAFYCDYEVFKNIYNLQARSVMRTGQSVFVGLLTLNEQGKEEVSSNIRERAMENLHIAMHNSLRRGDVYARFSATQFVMMLPTLTFENSDVVFKRIKKQFAASSNLKNIRIDAKFMPIDPVV
ncbi:MAG: BTAD domain-containing putative transcriptional regulator [Syntrophomonadaceae bacterium]|nr:BTAD domain-containing putative transcriptional regulator [Syntrophomonadaceae bacterium]